MYPDVIFNKSKFLHFDITELHFDITENDNLRWPVII